MFFGYNRDEVDAAIERRDAALEAETARANALAGQVSQLDQVADRLAQRVVERERSLAKARAELDEALVAREALPGPEVAVAAAAVAEAEVGPDSCVGVGEDVFDGRVEVDVGPLSDFGQLVSFEDAASEIGAAGEISVKGFAQGRATLELHLSEPVELLRELEERAPFEFRVRDTREDRVVLDVDAEAA